MPDRGAHGRSYADRSPARPGGPSACPPPRPKARGGGHLLFEVQKALPKGAGAGRDQQLQDRLAGGVVQRKAGEQTVAIFLTGATGCP